MPSLPILLAVALLAVPAAASARRRARAQARHSLRAPLTGENFYFVMADRFENGITANDHGGLPRDRVVTGFDPTAQGLLPRRRPGRAPAAPRLHRGPRHHRDLAHPELQEQGGPGRRRATSAGYHGYWITDFTQIDPHLGTNAELARADRRRARAAA